MYMSMPLYMSEADIILHVCVELMLNRYTPATTVLTIHALMCVAYIRTFIVHIMHMCNA